MPRNLIERFFNKIKRFRRIATRYDKLAGDFLAALKLAAVGIWLPFWPNSALRSSARRRRSTNPRSRLLYQAVVRLLVLVRRRWAGLVCDQLPDGNHRRGRACATRGGGR
jgi:hypothetical protein